MSNTSVTVRFGVRLRKLRKERGWTQVQMADIMGVDRSYICDMETGKKNVCLPTLEVFADGFGISMAKLISRL